MSLVIKATEADRVDYQKTGPVYPLYGWATLDGQRMAIEDVARRIEIHRTQNRCTLKQKDKTA
jgi:hypothetical protein